MHARSAGWLVGVLVASSAAAAPRLPDARSPAPVLTMAAPRRGADLEALAARGWRASWDRETGVPRWLWGSVAAPGSNADPAAAERVASAFLAQQLGVLAPGASVADFTVLANHVDARGLRTVTFEQRWRGMRVVDGAIGFVFGRDRLFAIHSRALPSISARLPRGASTRARRILRIDGAYRVVDVSEERGSGPDEHWEVYRDAITGAELERRSNIRFASGTLQYNAGVRWAGGTRTNYPASAASILVDSTSTLTTATGTFTWPGNATSSVISAVAGTYVRVINSAGASAMQTFNVAPGATAVWDASAVEFDDAQVSTYVYANIAKTRARVVNPAAIPWLDGQTDFHVNDAGTCNALSDGDSVRLFRGSANCENTGRIGDVVFHEFGHALHNHSVIAGMGNYEAHLSEGLADFFAANITGDPAFGRGFFRTDEPLRHIDPPGHERVYPRDLDFDTHISGLIIAGALWDLRKQLVTELGASAGIAQAEQIFTGVMQRAGSIGDSYTAALIADDDNADLGDGTPHLCAIERAFGRHGLVPGYMPTTVSPPVANGRDLAVHVTIPTGTSCPALAVAGVTVTWRANDGVASELALVASGDDWIGAFPEQPGATLITYSVDVTFADGSLASFPDNPADPRYQLFVGDSVAIWCQPFDDDPLWTETSNSGREWEWQAPLAEPSSPDPAAPYSGTAVFGTDLRSDGFYRPNLDTVVTTPVIQIPTYEAVRLQYWRWLTVEDAAFDHASILANDTEVWSNASTPAGTLDHVDREWRFHDIDLTPQITDGTLQLAWRLDSDPSKQLGGWTLDDVCIVGVGKIASCGDSVVDVGEQCDDGNRIDGDGCDATCNEEVGAGGGGCCSTTNGTGRSCAFLTLVVLTWTRRRRRLSVQA